MNEICPLGKEAVWDEQIPEACLKCWTTQQDVRQLHIHGSGTEYVPAEGTYVMQHGIERARRFGRRIITELMVARLSRVDSHEDMVVHTTKRDIACLYET